MIYKYSNKINKLKLNKKSYFLDNKNNKTIFRIIYKMNNLQKIIKMNLY